MIKANGLMALPFNLWKESLSWTRKQLERQERFWDVLTSQPDEDGWHSPNEIVLELQGMRLRQFHPIEPSESTPKKAEASEPAVLIVTPQVNSSFICDYGPGQSLAKTLMENGVPRVFATDWKSATPDRADETLDDAMSYIGDCIAHIGGPVRLVGLCQGGWMSMIHAALYPEQVSSLVLAAAPIDFHSSPGAVNWMALTYPMAFYQSLVMAGGGVLQGQMIATGFNNLRPLERYVGKYLQLYANIDNPDFIERFQRLNNWYSTPQNIPGATYLRIVKELFKQNRLIKGTLELHGRKVELKNVVAPLYLIAGTRDHITPKGQLYAAAKHVSSEVKEKYLADAGHIGVFMGQRSLQEVWPELIQTLRQNEKS